MAKGWPRGWGLASKVGAAALLVAGALGAAAPLLVTAEVASAAASTAQPRTSPRSEPIRPLEPPAPLDATGQARVALGALLFAEPRLSADDTLACSGCHDLAHGGADGRPVSVGIHGRSGVVNAPSVMNLDRSATLFWDGRATSLEAQVDGPLLSADEMGSRWDTVVRRLSATPQYVAEFASAYPAEGISAESIRGAIAAYERTLVTTGSRFDRFLLGDTEAISATEKLGYDRFRSYGCTTCHQGRGVGGNLFQKLGIMGDYFADRGGTVGESDYGRFNVTKDEADRFVFRVPSLRMVASTAPYFHDGSVPTLEEAVILMGRYQLGEEISSADVTAIVAFLGALEGTCDTGAVNARH